LRCGTQRIKLAVADAAYVIGEGGIRYTMQNKTSADFNQKSSGVPEKNQRNRRVFNARVRLLTCMAQI